MRQSRRAAPKRSPWRKNAWRPPQGAAEAVVNGMPEISHSDVWRNVPEAATLMAAVAATLTLRCTLASAGTMATAMNVDVDILQRNAQHAPPCSEPAAVTAAEGPPLRKCASSLSRNTGGKGVPIGSSP